MGRDKPLSVGLYLTTSTRFGHGGFMWVRHWSGRSWSAPTDMRDCPSDSTDEFLRDPARCVHLNVPEQINWLCPYQLDEDGFAHWPGYHVSPAFELTPVSVQLMDGSLIEDVLSSDVDWRQVRAFTLHDKCREPPKSTPRSHWM